MIRLVRKEEGGRVDGEAERMVLYICNAFCLYLSVYFLYGTFPYCLCI